MGARLQQANPRGEAQIVNNKQDVRSHEESRKNAKENNLERLSHVHSNTDTSSLMIPETWRTHHHTGGLAIRGEEKLQAQCGAPCSPDGSDRIRGDKSPWAPGAGSINQPAYVCYMGKLPKPSWEHKSNFKRQHDAIYIHF